MKSFSQLLKEEQSKEKHHVLAFGRMNPPTTGHLKLIDKVKSVAHKVGGEHTVVVSHSQDTKKNPLSGEQKVKHLKRYSPGTHFATSSKEHPTFLHHAAELNKKGVTHLHMIAGSDRVKEYHDKLHHYNGTHKGALYNFKKITVHSAGHRDPDAEGTEGMSGTKMREHAKNKDFSSFRQGVPSHVADHHAKELMHDVRRGMGLNENVDRGMFKAIFVTGGPGSGKDIVIREAIAEQKAVEINYNQAYNYLMDKKALSEKSSDFRRESIRNRGPLIINGPADDHTKLLAIKEELEELGYNTLMVFVETSDEVSQHRNERLSKMIAESVRQEKWKQAQMCKENYKKSFEKFITLNNSGPLENIQEDITDLYVNLNGFIDSKTINENAYMWLESHGKLNTIDYTKILVKEDNNVKKNSRFVQKLKESRGAKLRRGTSGPAEGPGDIPADNRAGDSNSDNIKWDAPKRTKTYTFRTYSEENQEANLKVYPEPKEKNFNKDKETVKTKKRGLSDSPTVNQRLRNQSGIGPEFDTRQQGTVYPMSGLGDVTYREEKENKSFRKTLREFNGFQNDTESGIGGTLSGADNKEPLEKPNDKVGYSYTINKYKKQKNGVKK